MKTLPIALLAITALILSTSYAQEGSFPHQTPGGGADFLQPGQWWNLYSDERNDAIKRSIRAVKIVRLSSTRPSWVQIAFPKNKTEHSSIFGPVARAHDNEQVTVGVEIAKWEKSITEWKYIWINLDFVVSMSPVKPDEVDEHPVAVD